MKYLTVIKQIETTHCYHKVNLVVLVDKLAQSHSRIQVKFPQIRQFQLILAS